MSTSSEKLHCRAALNFEPVDVRTLYVAPLGCPSWRGVTASTSSLPSLSKSPPAKRELGTSTSSAVAHTPAAVRPDPVEVSTE